MRRFSSTPGRGWRVFGYYILSPLAGSIQACPVGLADSGRTLLGGLDQFRIAALGHEIGYHFTQFSPAFKYTQNVAAGSSLPAFLEALLEPRIVLRRGMGSEEGYVVRRSARNRSLVSSPLTSLVLISAVAVAKIAAFGC